MTTDQALLTIREIADMAQAGEAVDASRVPGWVRNELDEPVLAALGGDPQLLAYFRLVVPYPLEVGRRLAQVREAAMREREAADSSRAATERARAQEQQRRSAAEQALAAERREAKRREAEARMRTCSRCRRRFGPGLGEQVCGGCFPLWERQHWKALEAAWPTLPWDALRRLSWGLTFAGRAPDGGVRWLRAADDRAVLRLDWVGPVTLRSLRAAIAAERVDWIEHGAMVAGG